MFFECLWMFTDVCSGLTFIHFVWADETCRPVLAAWFSVVTKSSPARPNSETCRWPKWHVLMQRIGLPPHKKRNDYSEILAFFNSMFLQLSFLPFSELHFSIQFFALFLHFVQVEKHLEQAQFDSTSLPVFTCIGRDATIALLSHDIKWWRYGRTED